MEPGLSSFDPGSRAGQALDIGRYVFSVFVLPGFGLGVVLLVIRWYLIGQGIYSQWHQPWWGAVISVILILVAKTIYSWEGSTVAPDPNEPSESDTSGSE